MTRASAAENVLFRRGHPVGLPHRFAAPIGGWANRVAQAGQPARTAIPG